MGLCLVFLTVLKTITQYRSTCPWPDLTQGRPRDLWRSVLLSSKGLVCGATTAPTHNSLLLMTHLAALVIILGS